MTILTVMLWLSHTTCMRYHLTLVYNHSHCFTLGRSTTMFCRNLQSVCNFEIHGSFKLHFVYIIGVPTDASVLGQSHQSHLCVNLVPNCKHSSQCIYFMRHWVSSKRCWLPAGFHLLSLSLYEGCASAACVLSLLSESCLFPQETLMPAPHLQ